ncbi:MAG: hypothetical protein A2X36_03115 [Elusimicrobia bacterium GWA2_69_24]|nr:MAG: hypothetical protein A2X36_03115 [Elusimicrobia bacterium GWA2_69_24]HBL19221.1 hypothetical protein [Elusimicrobiota bacterium]
MSVRVLIADDSAEYRDILAGMAGSLGWEAQVCADGASAIETARRVRPQLAILDIGLPDMDGFALCRGLRALPGAEQLPVILISGTYRRDEDRLRGLSDGAIDFLEKPFRLAELISKAKALARDYGGEDTAR